MRTFIALEVPESFVSETRALARALKGQLEGRFMDPGTYHITVAFLGEIYADDIDEVACALHDACAQRGPIPLASDGLGKFGKAGDATLWLGLQRGDAIMNLAGAVREELADRSISFDEKTFRPHVTLARRVRLPGGTLPALPFPQETVATRVTLFRSELDREGARYTALHTETLS